MSDVPSKEIPLWDYLSMNVTPDTENNVII